MWASLSSPSGCIDTLGEMTRLPFPVACGPPSLLPRAASTHTNSPSGTPMLANARRHVWWVWSRGALGMPMRRSRRPLRTSPAETVAHTRCSLYEKGG